jgi:hypothetical protein
MVMFFRARAVARAVMAAAAVIHFEAAAAAESGRRALPD